MPRIQGVDIPPDKPTHISLRYIRGLGPTTSLEVCEKLQHRPAAAGQGLDGRRDRPHRGAARPRLLGRRPAAPARRRRTSPGSRKSSATAASGTARTCPCRGQRTRTNARTRKGPRKTVAGKKGVKEMR